MQKKASKKIALLLTSLLALVFMQPALARGDITLNQQVPNATPGGNVITSEAVDLWIADTQFSHPIGHRQLSAGVDHGSGAWLLSSDTVGDTAVYLEREWRL